MPRVAWIAVCVALAMFGLYFFGPLNEVWNYIWETVITPFDPPDFLDATIGRSFIFTVAIAFFLGIFLAIFRGDKKEGE